MSSTRRPAFVSAHATAQPITPAPTTATSGLAVGLPGARSVMRSPSRLRNYRYAGRRHATEGMALDVSAFAAANRTVAMDQSAVGDAIAASGRADATAAPVTILFGAVRGAGKGSPDRGERRAGKRAHRGE